MTSNPTAEQKRFPLSPWSDPDDVADLALRTGLDLRSFAPAVGTKPREVVYSVRGRDAVMHYIYDPVLGIPYLTFEGSEAEELQSQALPNLKVLNAADAERLFTETSPDDESFEMVLGLGFFFAPANATPEAMKYFDAAFAHSSAEIRHYGVLATRYVKWPELLAPLARLAADDPNADVRAAAQKAQRWLSKKGGR